MAPVTLNLEMVVVLSLLALTVVLFVSEVVRVDLAAILVMVILGGLSYLPGLGGIADINRLFNGFSSNAVISIIAVMIVGAGLDRTGLMNSVARFILRFGGSSEKRIIPIVSGMVGIISSFMQNVGAASLFLPVVSRISARTELPLGRLLMPMGFCAILGGTMTLVGSSPLILLNDLIQSTNRTLPSDLQMRTFDMFSVTPVGFALVLTGILYFVVFGRWVLPGKATREEATSAQSMKEYVKRIYGLKADIFEVVIPEGHLLVGETLADMMEAYHLYIIGTYHHGQKWLAPPVETTIVAPCRLAVLGRRKVIQEIADVYDLRIEDRLKVFNEDFSPAQSGIAEIVIPPNSRVIGKTARDLFFRKTYGLNLLAIHRIEQTLSYVETEEHEATRIGTVQFQAGDTLVVQTQWTALTRLKTNPDFVIVTSEFPQEELRPKKVGWALLFFLVSISLILFTDVRLSLCLLTGAAGMIVTRVLSIDEAYRAVSWNTVFLLAGLIPLGQAVNDTGTAEWIAQQVLRLLEGWPVWSLQAGVAILATAFTLIMSNVGATVLLVPLAVSIAIAAGGNPALFAMTVAISTSNSFLIPTHQVNALIMGPAGYRVADFVRTGGIMTILFLIVSLVMMNWVF
ncbi:MAG: SLC13 family permease [Paracoccaceae bacterium]|nr:SLC13 family permease [Paracoccaceae bacterium]MDE2911652.1 SLC13 family permease [Paracoccaceae bacterium]